MWGGSFGAASASVGLNLAEGQYSRGKNRAARYHTALGSAREMSCFVIPEGVIAFEMAEALGYVAPLSAALRADFDRVIGTLVRLVERSG